MPVGPPLALGDKRVWERPARVHSMLRARREGPAALGRAASVDPPERGAPVATPREQAEMALAQALADSPERVASPVRVARVAAVDLTRRQAPQESPAPGVSRDRRAPRERAGQVARKRAPTRSSCSIRV